MITIKIDFSRGTLGRIKKPARDLRLFVLKVSCTTTDVVRFYGLVLENERGYTVSRRRGRRKQYRGKNVVDV